MFVCKSLPNIGQAAVLLRKCERTGCEVVPACFKTFGLKANGLRFWFMSHFSKFQYSLESLDGVCRQIHHFHSNYRRKQYAGLIFPATFDQPSATCKWSGSERLLGGHWSVCKPGATGTLFTTSYTVSRIFTSKMSKMVNRCVVCKMSVEPLQGQCGLFLYQKEKVWRTVYMLCFNKELTVFCTIDLSL